jgi:hypothetical protein
MNISNIDQVTEWFEIIQTTGRSRAAVMRLDPGEATGERAESHEKSEQLLSIRPTKRNRYQLSGAFCSIRKGPIGEGEDKSEAAKRELQKERLSCRLNFTYLGNYGYNRESRL